MSRVGPDSPDSLAEALVAELRARGVELRADPDDGQRLLFRPISALSPEVKARLREHKDTILALLAQEHQANASADAQQSGPSAPPEPPLAVAASRRVSPASPALPAPSLPCEQWLMQRRADLVEHGYGEGAALAQALREREPLRSPELRAWLACLEAEMREAAGQARGEHQKASGA